MKCNLTRCGRLFPCAVGLTLLLTSTSLGQTDNIKRRAQGRDIRCRVTDVSKTRVAYEIGGQKQEISAAEIQYVDFAGEPSELGRARTRLNSGQFADCLTELQKVDVGSLNSFLKDEYAYLSAMAEARRAMLEGSTTLRDAAAVVSQAIKEHGNTYHYYELAEQLGMLAFHAGELPSAEKQFQEMAASGVPYFALRGNLFLGRTLLEENKLTEAKSSLAEVANSEANDDFAQDAKLIAQCLSARVMAKEGQAPQAIQLLQTIIGRENSDRKQVFAACYNSLGICHLAASDLKNAKIDFLETDLLYGSESEWHAEALYYLSDVWAQLGRTDDSMCAKQTLSKQYRNSFWASKK